jgi:hypothetical protein
MIEILLTRNAVMLIDEADSVLFSDGRWQAYPSPPTNKLYARQNRFRDGRWVSTLAHRLITNAGPGQFVDHVNGDTLDNRRANLRLCNRNENNRNRRLNRTSTSGFKGVCWYKQTSRWKAQICVNGHKRGLGYFNTREAAAAAYDAAAVEAFGEYAMTNAKLGLL